MSSNTYRSLLLVTISFFAFDFFFSHVNCRTVGDGKVLQESMNQQVDKRSWQF